MIVDDRLIFKFQLNNKYFMKIMKSNKFYLEYFFYANKMNSDKILLHFTMKTADLK